jgi:hypothetical protein
MDADGEGVKSAVSWSCEWFALGIPGGGNARQHRWRTRAQPAKAGRAEAGRAEGTRDGGLELTFSIFSTAQTDVQFLQRRKVMRS